MQPSTYTRNIAYTKRKARRSRRTANHPQGVPGPFGPPAVNLARVRPVPLTALSPGTVVYARVPYKEDCNAGKCRPVVVVAASKAKVIVLPITSKGHRAAVSPLTAISDLDAAGLDRPSWVQGRRLSIDRCDITRVLGELADADQAEILPAVMA